MKRRFLPLLIACIVILTSMSECKDGDVPFVSHTEYSPVSAELNGISYTSGDYTYLGWGGNPFLFSEDEASFSFSLERTIESEKNAVIISVEVNQSVPFEFDKEYPIDKEGGHIVFKRDDGVLYSFLSTDGHIVFTDDSTEGMSGRFEFSATDAVNDSTIIVTNGTFENLWTRD